MSDSALRPIGIMRVTDTHNAYGFMDQPGFQGTDRLCDLSFVNAYEQSHVRYDPVARCVYAEPQYVPHHNLRAAGTDLVGWVTAADGELTPVVVAEEDVRGGLPGYPVVRWRLVTKTPQTDLVSCVFAPLDYTGIRAQLTPGKEHDPSGLSFTAAYEDIPSGTQGFYCFKRLSAGQESPDAERTLAFEFWVSDDRYWRVDYSNPFGLRLHEYKDGELRQLTRMRSTQSFAEVAGQERFVKDELGTWAPVVHADQTALVVLLVNGLIQIWVHGQAQPLVVSCPDFASFTKVRVIGHGGRYAYFSVHPMCFAADAYLVANEKQVGFVRRSSTPIEYRVVSPSTPTGSTVDATTEWEQGSEFRYRLQFTNDTIGAYKNEPYARSTGTATGVTYRIAPYMVRRLDATGEFPHIREAKITTTFDWQNLNITSKATVVMNNRHGEWREGWPYGNGLGKGNRAVSLDLGWMGPNGYAINRRFTGIGGLDTDYTRSIAPESTVAISCEDLSVIPREYPLMNCPWMDGWCHLYAIRFLAWLAGISDEQMDFEYCNDPFCSNPDHYHLPIGEGMNPRMYFGPGTTAWQAMNRIRALTGHIMYFDVWGKLRYYPWVRTAPGPFKRVFYDSADGALDQFQTIEQVSFRRSTRSVRTGVTIVGVNANGPAWDPVVAHRSNEAAIYDRESPSYKGFRSPTAWADSMFASEEYASDAADAVSALVSLPGETLTLMQRLAMGDLYALDVIGVYDSKMPTSVGAACKAFFITQTVDSYASSRTHKDYSMLLSGRWIV